MTGVDAERLRRLLGRPELRPVLDRLQRQMELGTLGETLTFSDLGPAARTALETLLGRRPGHGSSLRIRVNELQAVLRNAGAAPDLPTAVTTLRGPIRDLRGERETEQAVWSGLFDATLEHASTPEEQAWLEALRAEGLLKRLSGGDATQGKGLLEAASLVLSRLPAAGVGLSRLAAETLGDAHGLDRGRPVATLVRRYLARTGSAEGAEGERALWAGAGVLVGGGVTSRVLLLNLGAAENSPTGRMLGALTQVGQPAVLTLRQLVTDRPQWQPGGADVYICENPAVVAAAADRFGPHSRPLVCNDGQPSAAVATLLQSLNKTGVILHYHGDFDWPGITIANGILERFGARPWRFDSRAYLDAPASGKRLSGRAVSAGWEPELTAAMQRRGLVVEEELVLEGLLTDLQD